MFDNDDEAPSPGYWPSVTDLFMTLFIISIAILAAVFFMLLPKNNIAGPDPVKMAVGQDFVHVVQPVNQLREELDLQKITYRSAAQVIRDLTETCHEAVERIRRNKANLVRMSKLMDDPDAIIKLQNRIVLLEKEKTALERQLKELLKTRPEAGELARLLKENEKLKRQLAEENVNLVIDERRKEFRFDSGSSVIKRAFTAGLKEHVFPELATEIKKRQNRVDTLEIIGHTDGVPLSTSGNLDQRLPELLAGEFSGFSRLTAGSNNDLGLLRALALKKEWQEYAQNDILLQSINIRCYSAGQTILPTPIANPRPDQYRRSDPSARRIEMRLTRLGK